MQRKVKTEEVLDVEVVTVGDQIIDKDNLTPSVYFDYVKGLKQKLNNEEYDIIIDTTLKMLKKTKVTGQTAMAKELAHQLDLALRELDAAKDGFDIFVNRKDIERYIEDVEAKSIKIIELDKYERDIPDDVVEKLEKARKHFDEIYIVFTDYTKKETKKVAKERRDKDPIMFGAFHDKDEEKKNNIYVEDRLFFIADWKEEKCDLTLEEIVRDIQNKDDKDITYKISRPEDEAAVKSMLKSFTEPIEKMEPTNIFARIKKKITRKKVEKVVAGETKKRGRKKKTVEAEE